MNWDGCVLHMAGLCFVMGRFQMFSVHYTLGWTEMESVNNGAGGDLGYWVLE